MNRVAIPVFEGQLSEYFGQCDHYEIFEIDDATVKNIVSEVPPGEYVTKLPEWASIEKITDIIVYRIEKSIINLFAPLKINLFVGVHINTPGNLIEDYINGMLKLDEGIISEIVD